MMNRLLELYKKTQRGHGILSDSDFIEYSELRKKEFQDRKTELLKEGKTDVKVCKDETGDIIGWTFKNKIIEETPKI